MDTQESLLAHIALRLSTHPENVATECLWFLLRRSEHVRRSFDGLVERLSGTAIGGTTLESQVTSEKGDRPDLVATLPDGSIPLVLELKFWAGLTDAQPLSYLAQLRPSGLLLFVAPRLRVNLLWLELLRRCTDGGVAAVEQPSSGDFRMATAGSCKIGVMSWPHLVEVLLHGAHASADSTATSNLQQLSALCARMDDEAFLPLSREELSSNMGNRLIQLGQLAIDVTDTLTGRGLASTKGCRTSGGNGWFGRYLWIRGHGCLIFFNAWHWRRFGDGPLWFEVKGPQWELVPHVQRILADASIHHYDTQDGIEIPLPVRPGVEKQGIIDAAVELILKVSALLPDLPGLQGHHPETLPKFQ